MEVVQKIIDALGSGLTSAVGLLPQSPFSSYLSVSLDSDILSTLNWVLPIGQIITILEAWVTAIALWYAVQIILRWAKAIE